jgi:hypothetical protein
VESVPAAEIPVERRSGLALERLRPAALPLALGAGVFLLALRSGAYGLELRDGVAIGLWWMIVLAVGVLIWPLERVPRGALATGGALAAFGAFAGLSALWAHSAQLAFDEFNRVMLYVAVFAVAVLAARRASAARWADGLALGIAAVGLLALVSRLFPHLVGNQGTGRLIPVAQSYLNYPLDYWNGLGIFLALGFPLLLRAGVGAGSRTLRGLAVGVIPAMATALYLTSSRGGAATAVVATLAVLVLSNRRYAVLGALLVAAAGSAGAVAVVSQHHALVDGPVTGSVAIAEGRAVAGLLALICVVVGCAYVLLAQLRWNPPRIGRRLAIAMAVAAVAVIGAGVAASHPAQRWKDFKAPPVAFEVGGAGASASSGSAEGVPTTGTHLTSTSSNGRWQFWEAAVDELKHRPAIGEGAGSYAAWWAQHGSVAYFTRHAHSLYLQTLGELGVVGGLLLALFLVCAGVAVVRRLRESRGGDRLAVAALGAVVVAYAFGAGIDWMWELTVVSVVGIVALAALAGPAARAPAAAPASAGRSGLRVWAPRVALVLAGLGLIVAQAIPFASAAKIAESQKRAGAGDLRAALRDANSARDIQPWASEPYLQLALVRQALGQLPQSRSAIRHAISNDTSDWRLWLVAANIERQSGAQGAARRDLARAASLNPRSPLFAQTRSRAR